MAENTTYTYDDDVLDYDSEISEEGFPTIPAGDYDFTVVSAERDRFSGNEKAKACPIVKLTCRVDSAQGTVDIQHRFFLYKKNEWQLSQFFACVGLKKKGEPLKMNWQAAIGRKGRCKVGKRQYNGNDYLEIKKFYEPAGAAPAPVPAGGGF